MTTPLCKPIVLSNVNGTNVLKILSYMTGSELTQSHHPQRFMAHCSRGAHETLPVDLGAEKLDHNFRLGIFLLLWLTYSCFANSYLFELCLGSEKYNEMEKDADFLVTWETHLLECRNTFMHVQRYSFPAPIVSISLNMKLYLSIIMHIFVFGFYNYFIYYI